MVEQGEQTRWFAYDSLGRLTRQKLAEQTATINSAGQYVGAGGSGAQWSDSFVYDVRSNLVQRTDARGVKTNFNYNIGSTPDPLNRLQGISYDTSVADMSYGMHGTPSVTLEYMTSGDKTRIRKVSDYIANEENTYDIEGRISDYTLTINARQNHPLTTSYLYDTVNRLTEVRYPAQYGIAGNPRRTVTPTYDETSRLKELKVNNQIQLNEIIYNPMSQVTQLKTGAATGNADVETYSYDNQTGLLTNQTVVKANTNQPLLNLSYEYNRGASNGNLNGRTGQLTRITNNLDHNKNRLYEFDTLGRLRTAKGGLGAGVGNPQANWTQNYSYDRYGNRETVTASGVTVNNQAVPTDGLPSLSYNKPSNRIATPGYEYDLAGNLTRGQDQSGNWQRYYYDAAGRLIDVKNDAGNYTQQRNLYGAGRQRLYSSSDATTEITYYCWGGSAVLSEYTTTQNGSDLNWKKSYVYAGSRLLSTATNNNGTEVTEFHHPDRLGTKLVTNNQANTSFEQSTLPFGTALDGESTGSTNQRFTSYDRNTIASLDYAVNRSYSAGQSRFTSVDPIGMSATSIGNPQSNNLYAYVENNPIDFTDPSGLDSRGPGIGGPQPHPTRPIKDVTPPALPPEYVTVPWGNDDPFGWAGGSGISDAIFLRGLLPMPEPIDLGTVGVVTVTAGDDIINTAFGSLIGYLSTNPGCASFLNSVAFALFPEGENPMNDLLNRLTLNNLTDRLKPGDNEGIVRADANGSDHSINLYKPFVNDPNKGFIMFHEILHTVYGGHFDVVEKLGIFHVPWYVRRENPYFSITTEEQRQRQLRQDNDRFAQIAMAQWIERGCRN